MSNKKFLPIAIYAPSYNPKSGGAIILHLLCHELINLGYAAFLVPFHHILDSGQPFIVNRKYRNIFLGADKAKECIVLYPEITIGNPIESEYVIRWCLNKPTVMGGDGIFGDNDILIAFSEEFKDSTMIDEVLTVYDPNLPSPQLPQERKGAAFCIRKGMKTPQIAQTKNLLELTSYWPIDLQQYADIFHKLERFYSYDTETFLSYLAAYCGCESIVIPKPGLSYEEWKQNKPFPTDSLSYGVEYNPEKRKYIPELIEFLNQYKETNRTSVQQLIRIIEREWDVGVLPLKQVNREWLNKEKLPFQLVAFARHPQKKRIKVLYKQFIRTYKSKREDHPTGLIFCNLDHPPIPSFQFINGFPRSGKIETEADFVIFYRGATPLSLEELSYILATCECYSYLGAILLDPNMDILPKQSESLNKFVVFALTSRIVNLMDFDNERVFEDFFEKLIPLGYQPT